ncbi:MAG TPA: hypothetical protein VGJ81_09225 [Thermoanaerobaculia bacterium]
MLSTTAKYILASARGNYQAAAVESALRRNAEAIRALEGDPDEVVLEVTAAPPP